MISTKEIEKGLCLVTGGAGFIGSHLVSRLLSLGSSVIVIDDLSSGLESNLGHLPKGSLEIRKGTILDRDLLHSLPKEIDYVFHLAARPSVPKSIEDPIGSHLTNVDGTLAVLEESRRFHRLKRLVNTSSSSVYGDSKTLPKQESETGQVLSPYALQKATGEHYSRLYFELYQVPTVSVRPFNVFGPGQRSDSPYAAVIPKFISAARDGNSLFVHGDGKQTRDFTYVDNMVDHFLCAALTPHPLALGNAFNAAAGERHSILALAEEIIELTGSPSKIVHGADRAGDIRDSFADLSESRAILGFEAKINFKNGLRKLVNELSKA